MSVIIETTLGDITIDLMIKERPRSEFICTTVLEFLVTSFDMFWFSACLNFLKLCKIKYYNYAVFFNVQRDFIAQTGDPTGTGTGGESVFRYVVVLRLGRRIPSGEYAHGFSFQ